MPLVSRSSLICVRAELELRVRALPRPFALEKLIENEIPAADRAPAEQRFRARPERPQQPQPRYHADQHPHSMIAQETPNQNALPTRTLDS